MVREASHSGGTGGQGPGKRRTLRKAVKPFDPSRIEANEQMVAPRSKMNLTKQAQYNWEETKPARFPMHTNHLLTGTIASIVGTWKASQYFNLLTQDTFSYFLYRAGKRRCFLACCRTILESQKERMWGLPSRPSSCPENERSDTISSMAMFAAHPTNRDGNKSGVDGYWSATHATRANSSNHNF